MTEEKGNKMLDKQDIIIFVLAIIFMTIAAYNIDSFIVVQWFVTNAREKDR